MLAEVAEGALDGVALPVDGGAEGGRAAAFAAAPQPVAGLVGGFGDGGFDATLAQVGADRAAGVGLIAQEPPGPGPRPATAPARYREAVHEREERQGVMALAGVGHPGQRPAPRLGKQVDLGGQPARTGPAPPTPAALGQYRPAAGAGPGRVLVRPDHRRIRRHRPLLPCCLIAAGAQAIQDHLPGLVP